MVAIMENIYIDIGAKRIQTWISKPVKLKYVRGGSLLLSKETSKHEIEKWLNDEGFSDLEVAAEAGDIDGVVVLKNLDSLAVTDERADEVAKKLLLHLNDRIPGVDWSGWCCRANTFLEAYQLAAMKDSSERSYQLVPSVSEFSGLSSCTGCKSEPSIKSFEKVDEYLGKDCLSRFENASSDDFLYWGGWSLPEDFDDLARRRGKGFSGQRLRNHIATICGDGNRIGALFDKFNQHAELAKIKTEAIAWLTFCTEEAVNKAANEVRGEGENGCVVIPHYVGGDDVLVSVVADQAWRFAVELIKSFEEIKEYYLADIDEVPLSKDVKNELEDLVSNVSLGVGMVFSRYSYPFYECRHKAEEALSYAKQTTQGKQSAICWMDLTEGGGNSQYTEDKYVISYKDASSQLNDESKVPDVIGMLTSSAQHNLRNQMIAWKQEHPKNSGETSSKWLEECSEYLEKWIIRTRDEEDEKIYIDINTLEADLHRARWWPNNAGDKEKSSS